MTTSKLRTLWERAFKGVKKEENVSDILNGLPDEFAVFHNIESPYGHLDHLVVTPKNQVIHLEVKSEGGTMTWDGSNLLQNGRPTDQDIIYQALKKNCWLKNKIQIQCDLDLFIRPVIVFSEADVKIGNPVKGMQVIHKKDLLKTVRNLSQGKRAEQEFRTVDLLELFAMLQGLQKVDPLQSGTWKSTNV